MSCLENTPCNPCGENSYDNCGCLNPTTFECITLPGVLSALGITNDMNGLQVLQAINDVIANLDLPTPPAGSDVYAKVSSTDTTSDYLDNKLLAGTYMSKTVLNPGFNEKIRFNVVPEALISADSGNFIELGTDGKLRAIPPTPVIDMYVVGGTGVTVTGTGPATDPFIVSINPSITATRACFDGVWRNITLTATGNANVVYLSGTPQYRVRFDGTIEFRGSATYTVNFGAYSDLAGTRKRTVTIGNISTITSLSTGCGVSAAELIGTADLKSINYIEQPGVGDQITQQYGYIVRKSGTNLILEFQSAFISATSKQIVVNFEGVTIHPNI